MAKISERIRHAWNAFTNTENDTFGPRRQFDYGPAYSSRPDRTRLRYTNEKSIISSIDTRISVDCSSIDIRHVRLDENKRYVEDIDSGMNQCFTVEANVDQAATAFRRDIFMTILDKGVAAIVPIDTTVDPLRQGSFDIKTMRVGEVINWYPEHVGVRVWRQDLGHRVDIVLPKRMVAIVENPLYLVMNEPNSTLQRLIRKLNLLDVVDDQSSSGKLDLIIQLPYVIKSEARRQQADQRRKDIEFQLKGSKYGIAYTDGTEKITQLNRPAENNLMKEIEYLTTMLYGQLGITEEVLNGTADEKTMLNYMNRTIVPLMTAVVEAMRRTFLTKTARTQMQSIEYFSDPFKLVPIDNIAEIADKFTRNEIMSANEIRSVIGMKPSNDPKADELRNSNMPAPADAGASPGTEQPVPEEDASAPTDDGSAEIDEIFNSLESSVDDILSGAG